MSVVLSFLRIPRKAVKHLSAPIKQLRGGDRSIHISQKPTIYQNEIRSTGSNSILRRWHSDTASQQTSIAQSSVSSDEVSHFTRLASSWWDPRGPSRLLHLMNPLRHDFIQSCLSSSATAPSECKFTYLDIGCGGGIFASSAARHPLTQSVTAIDPTPSVIQVAKSHQRSDPALAEPKLRYLNCAIEDLASSTSETTFDVITLFEVIEHISAPSAFLRTTLQHLKPGGWLVGSTIARHPVSWVTTKLIAEAPFVGIVPRGTHDWEKYINPEELQVWFEKEDKNAENAWGPLKVEGVVYVPTLGWRWVKGSENVGNYFFAVQKLR